MAGFRLWGLVIVVLRKGDKIVKLGAKHGDEVIELAQFSQSSIEAGVLKTIKDSGNNIFNGKLHPKPYLNKMAKELGGEANLIRATLNMLNNRLPTKGFFEETVNISGVNLTVRGFVKDGVPTINTMFK